MSASAVATVDTVRVDFGFGAFELEGDERRELVRLLGLMPDAPAATAAAHLEAAPAIALSDAELDVLADAAWAWLEDVGPQDCPERVRLLLDALRARRAHD